MVRLVESNIVANGGLTGINLEDNYLLYLYEYIYVLRRFKIVFDMRVEFER